MFGGLTARASPSSRDRCCPRRSSRDRPLWELWIADKLDDGRIGVVGKAHHCMVDGIAAVELAQVLLDPEPDSPPEPRDEWEPAASPGRRDGWWTGWSTGRATSWHWPGRPRGSYCHRGGSPAV